MTSSTPATSSFKRSAEIDASRVRVEAQDRKIILTGTVKTSRCSEWDEPASTQLQCEEPMRISPTAKGPFCQSCAMPLAAASDFGTGADGVRVNDYCRYCYRDGQFTEPALTEAAMIEKCVSFIVRQSLMTEAHARVFMEEVVPNLKRWRESKPTRELTGIT